MRLGVRKRLLSPNWPSRDQIQALVELSVPLFIFAAIVCRYIGSKGSDPEGYLKNEEEDKEVWLRGFQELVGSIIVLGNSLYSVLSIPYREDVPGKNPFWIDEKDIHNRLVSYLKGLRQNICNLAVPGILRSKINKQIVARGLPPKKRYIHNGDLIYLFLYNLIRETYKCIPIVNSL
ncbi:hypothetical protein V2W45_1464463 [Cenococcum geophilum]